MTRFQRFHQFVAMVLCPLVCLACFGLSAISGQSIWLMVWWLAMAAYCLFAWAYYAGMEGVKC